VSPVLIGRDDELSAVVSAVASPPSLVVVEGEAGIGKSRLIREVVAAVSGRTTVLVGHCQQLHEPFPLGPVIDAFQHSAALIHARDLSPVVGSLALLMPELADRLPEPPAPRDDQHEARHQIFRAATELLGHLAPAVLVLEDVHWADTVTLDFITYLVAHQPRELSVVVTTRSEGGTTPVGEAFARAPAGRSRTVRLEPLDPAEVGELSRQLLGSDVPAATASALFDVTGGVPFVVEEVLRTLLDRLPAAEIPGRSDEIAALTVSTALRDVVRQRLMALTPTAREAVWVAATAGMTVDADLVAEVAGFDDRTVATALTQAHASGLLHEQDGRSRFRHVLAQQIVSDEVPAPTRRWQHQRIAEVLEARQDPSLSARIAFHYRSAGRPADFVRFAEAAADRAAQLGNDGAAAEFLSEAAGEMAGLPIADRVRLATKLGRAAVDGLAHSEAVPILTRLLDAQDFPAEARGELRFALGRLHRQQGFALDGYREIELAVEDLHARPDLQARALAVLSAPETIEDLPVEVYLARSEQAEQAARRAASPGVELAVRIARASLLLELGRPGAWDLIDATRRDPVLLARPREQARAAINWTQAALHVGFARRADELLAEGGAVTQQTGSLRLIEVYQLVAAMADHTAGRWDGLAERAHELAGQVFGYDAISLETRFLDGMMLASRGDTIEATERLSTLVDDCERVGAVWPLAPARAALARLRLTMGDPEESLRCARVAVDHVGRKGVWPWAADAMVCLVDAAAVLGRIDEVRAPVSEFAGRMRDAEAPAGAAAARICEALVARTDGDAASAESLVRAARAIADDAGLVLVSAAATERLGEWLCERGDGEGAQLLTDALTFYGRLAARHDIARVTRSMRRYGLPVPYPWRGGRPAHGSRLSGREEEVVRLASEGRTNREIAAVLFLSPRTVESHMSSALRKLGLHSRDDLGAHLAAADVAGDDGRRSSVRRGG